MEVFEKVREVRGIESGLPHRSVRYRFDGNILEKQCEMIFLATESVCEVCTLKLGFCISLFYDGRLPGDAPFYLFWFAEVGLRRTCENHNGPVFACQN